MNRKTATPQRGTKGVATNMAKADDPMALWASNAVTQLLDGQDEPPAYGSPAWRRLPGDDPRRAAAILTAAESWRRFGCEDMSVIEAAEMWRRYGSDQVLTWFRESSVSHRPLADRRTLAELDALSKPKPPRPVQATAGWPPVAIPGRPGWHRHLVDGQQIDLRDNAQEGAA
ncbi:DUF2742 domain-containing protein [Streptomyces sp. NPDC001027]|uniref:DUF2742 domain-containing protein n=1 Tax=Streptomyces sp. NPDC001027 TaxID=3154771 RepID=UPI00331FFF26